MRYVDASRHRPYGSEGENAEAGVVTRVASDMTIGLLAYRHVMSRPPGRRSLRATTTSVVELVSDTTFRQGKRVPIV